MRKPPEKPTSLRPQGTRSILPKPNLIIDSMEQKPYSFKAFRKWFAAIERKKLAAGDYSIAGLEDRVAVERKSLQDLFNCCSPYHSGEAFVRASVWFWRASWLIPKISMFHATSWRKSPNSSWTC